MMKTPPQGFTLQEIMQQPAVWKTLQVPAQADRALRIDLGPTILTGAGTSAYIGQILAPYLRARLRTPFDAISTTDLVSVPQHHLLPQNHGLLVSYARSGDSPESLAACQVFNQVIGHPRHLIIQCNPDGQLALATKTWRDTLSLTMPAPALDRGFAMTSSFTSMLLTTLKLFAPDPDQEHRAIQAAETMIERAPPIAAQWVRDGFSRVVFLGSGCLEGLAREAALKMLELTAGQTIAMSETILGFRHGPKSIITKDTVIVILNSSDPLLSKYENDLIEELHRDDVAKKVISLKELANINYDGLDDAWRSVIYILFCQFLALNMSLSLGLDPDQPFPSGTVNRVVKGVRIYPSPWGLEC